MKGWKLCLGLRVLLSAAAILSSGMAAMAGQTAPARRQQLEKSFGPIAELSRSFEELAERVNPAVVQIFATAYLPGRGLVSPAELLSMEKSSGSGVILDPQGHMVTNAHVVSGARRIQVLLARSDEPPGTSILKGRGKLVGAQTVGIDWETDLAVLKIQEEDLSYLPLGDSNEIKAGQLVFAFGSPFGLDNTVTMGVVSSTARQLRTEDPMIYIQTDAPINPGSSGGPLVNTRGEVVGINTLIVSQSGGNEGIGFAAPSNIVRFIYEQLRATGRVRRGEIGVNAQTITPLLAKGLDLSRTWGVVLSDVYPGGPADEAGLQVGDVVVTLDGKIMENGRQFHVNVYGKPIGQTTVLGIERGGRTTEVPVKVTERRNDLDRFVDLVSPDVNLVPQLGILGMDMDSGVRSMLGGLRRSRGVLVAARSVSSLTVQEQGLLPGDVIYSVNLLPMTSLSDLRAAMAQLRPGDPAVIHVERQGKLIYVTVEVD